MNDTEKNLLAAFAGYNPDEITHTYRVYYDSTTGECLYTDVKLHDAPFVEIDSETFNNFNPIFYRVVNGKIKPREITRTDKRILVIGAGPYQTLKGASMFLVPNGIDKHTTQWKVNDDC